MPLRLLRHLRFWPRLATLVPPYLPVAAWLSFVGWSSMADHGIAPDPLRALLPEWLVWCWTLAIAFGGLGAVVGALSQRTRLESAALGILGWGIALWAVALGVVGSHDSWLLAVVLLAMCALRLEVLRQARRAKEEAAATVIQWRAGDR